MGYKRVARRVKRRRERVLVVFIASFIIRGQRYEKNMEIFFPFAVNTAKRKKKYNQRKKIQPKKRNLLRTPEKSHASITCHYLLIKACYRMIRFSSHSRC
ncbi:MAG: hypothetical protein IK144_03815 [Bacteroidaceae bacterium]|nr:hypothetical protein [Bacteroidaceae bacterium]